MDAFIFTVTPLPPASPRNAAKLHEPMLVGAGAQGLFLFQDVLREVSSARHWHRSETSRETRLWRDDKDSQTETETG